MHYHIKEKRYCDFSMCVRNNFQSTKRIFRDNERGFFNDGFWGLREKLNALHNILSESLRNNNINKCYKAILIDMIIKVHKNFPYMRRSQPKIALANVLSYSPNQQVFGKNHNSTSVLHEKLFALDHTLKSNVLLDSLNAHQSFISAVSMNKFNNPKKCQ